MKYTTERVTTSSQLGIPLGDVFFEGMVQYYNLSIKAKDFEDL
jgi:hypothetical protein